LTEKFLCKAEISRLLDTSPNGTSIIYNKAVEIDRESGRDYEFPKVSMESVLKASKKDFNLLCKQTKMRMLQHPHIDDLAKSSSSYHGGLKNEN